MSLALFTDLYQLIMAQSYWRAKIFSNRAIFHLNFRKNPFGGSYAIAAGLASVIEWLEHFSFSTSDIEYLATLNNTSGKKLFCAEFLTYLTNFSFSCDVDAIAEGTVVSGYEPLIRIEGPIIEAQIIESALLNFINFQTLIATKATRIVSAAYPDPVVEFGLRRAQGIDGALSATRAAFIGGCNATSNLLAAKKYHIPACGTHGHSWVMAFDSEKKAFQNFLQSYGEESVLLIDTYNSLEGAKNALEVAKETKIFPKALRLDSGDLAQISKEVYDYLVGEQRENIAIMASNELDEYLIRDLKQQGAKISQWGVGTKLVVGKPEAALDGVYKLSALQDENHKWHYKIKLSEQSAKVTIPGKLQVRRFFDDKHFVGDIIFNELEEAPKPYGLNLQDLGIEKSFHHLSYRDLLIPIFRAGKKIYQTPSLKEIQQKVTYELNHLKPAQKRFLNPEPYFVGLEKNLYHLRHKLIQKRQSSL